MQTTTAVFIIIFMLFDGHLVLGGKLSKSCSLSESDASAILDAHNDHRKSVGASNMNKLVWNSDLAEKAQLWTDQCNMVHRPKDVSDNDNLCGLSGYRSIGENLYAGSGMTCDSGSVIDATDKWMKEGHNFTLPNICSQVCGHYTQTVWANSNELGCGMSTCSILIHPSAGELVNYRFVACYYGPAGNMVTASGAEPPFTTGSACSQCDSANGVCEDGLCTKDPSYTTQCKDDSTSCAHYAQYCGMCDPDTSMYYDFMNEMCPKTCDYC